MNVVFFVRLVGFPGAVILGDGSAFNSSVALKYCTLAQVPTVALLECWFQEDAFERAFLVRVAYNFDSGLPYDMLFKSMNIEQLKQVYPATENSYFREEIERIVITRTLGLVKETV
jgi:hypothetical protein